MVEEDVEVVRVDEAVLGRGLEQVLGVGGQELVDRRRGAHQRREARPGAAPGSAHLLPGAGDGARVADADRRVERADVDAELEGVRGHHPADAPVPQPGLDLVPLVRQVAAPIATDRVRVAGRRLERLAQVAGEHLDRRPRAREGDRLHAAADEPLGEALPGEQRRRPDAELPVGDRRVDDEDVLAAGRRAVVVDDGDRRLEDPLGKLPGIRDRGGGADEDRIRPVVGADPAQPADDVGDVAAEQPPVRVELVDDDVAQVLEQLEPLRVVRKDGRVEHVRVGDDHLPGGPDDGANVRRCVAVVRVRLQADVGGAGQGAQLDELIGGEGLGGEEVERAGGGVLRDRIEDREVVAERLARCGRRDDDDVPAHGHRLVRGRLVGVRRLDAAPAERISDAGIQAGRPRAVARRPWLQHPVRRDERRHVRAGEEGGDRLVGVARRCGQHRLLPWQIEHPF